MHHEVLDHGAQIRVYIPPEFERLYAIYMLPIYRSFDVIVSYRGGNREGPELMYGSFWDIIIRLYNTFGVQRICLRISSRRDLNPITISRDGNTYYLTSGQNC